MVLVDESSAGTQPSWLPNATATDTSSVKEGLKPPLTRSQEFTLDNGADKSDDLFVQAVLATLIHRYTGIDQVRIGVDSTGVRDRLFTFERSTSARSLVQLSVVNERPDGQHRHAAVSPMGRSEVVDGNELLFEVTRTDSGQIRARFCVPATRWRASAERMVGHFRTLATLMWQSPSSPVALMNLLTEEETVTILRSWNNTDAEVTPHRNIYEAFEAQVAANSQATAVISGTSSLSYRELSDRARNLAGRLRSMGVGPDVRVGLCLNRSVDLLVGVLGVLAAGGAYVPLDPDYPKDRLLQMIRGVQCQVTICSDGVIAANPSLGDALQPIYLINRIEDWACGTEEQTAIENVGACAQGDDLCYVMHTSGTTGAPKPIALCHRGVLNNLADLNARFGVGPGDSVLALSSPSFDMSVYEFLGTVLAGGTVVIPDIDIGHHPATWVELLSRHNVTVWNSAPALVDLLLDHLETIGDPGEVPVRLCITGGDWVPSNMPARFRRFAPTLRFVAVGGATEASVSSTFFDASESAPQGPYLPLGRPLANQRVYVLDGSMMPVPAGVPGELYLAGAGLAREYLNLPAATAERFVQHRFPHGMERLYRTGDIVLWGPDGTIEMLGRRDFQVKVGGRRIELGEIEAVLTRHRDVKQAVVVARNLSTSTMSLVAYVIPSEPNVEVNDLFVALRAVLPKFMVPAVIELLEAFPLNANGKVDRQALATMKQADITRVRAACDANWQSIILAAWEDIMEMELTPDDDFFDAGGDSIAAIKSFTRIDSRLKLADIYGHPTAAELSTYMDAKFGAPPGDCSP